MSMHYVPNMVLDSKRHIYKLIDGISHNGDLGDAFDFLYQQLAFKGYNVKLFPVFYLQNNYLFDHIVFYLMYQDIKADRVIYDEGASAGTNWGASYQEYAQRNQEFGAQLVFFVSNTMFHSINFYFGGGLKAVYIHKHYYIDGVYAAQTPADFNEEDQKYALSLNIGLKIYLCKL